MHEFRPDRNTLLTIGAHRYQFLPHQLLPHEVQKIPREQATTYKVRREDDQTLWALKILHGGQQERRAAQVTEALQRYQNLPGLQVAQRICLTRVRYPELIASFPVLENALLMPWITGSSWTGFMDDPEACARYTCRQALQLALVTAQALWNLEAQHIAHTDIAGDNVIVLNFKHIELIDLEGCYLPSLAPPAQRSRGWQGYQHPHLDRRGNYRPDGDRFAGAMLLTEMLTWWNSLVRAATPEDYDALFQQHRQESEVMQERRLKIIRHTLWTVHAPLRRLFDQAWSSSDLSHCPDFSTWVIYLLQALE
jgi:hypothetical protein